MTQQPFPALTRLHILQDDKTAVIPDSFLRGSTPHLQQISLSRVPFPALPKLLLSATRLVTPGTMVTCLSSLTSLETRH
jgi:hypothetical protein